MKTHQFEIAVVGDVFNLAVEQADDPLRVELDRLRALREQEAALEYHRKMQRLLEECPGFIGADPGKVVVEPGRIGEAMAWLKKRFHVNESLELSTDTGLCIEVKPRQRRKPGSTGKRSLVKFSKPEQFDFFSGIDS